MLKIPAKKISYSSLPRDYSAVRFIVIHYTAGRGDTAENEGNYFKNVNDRKAGAHFFIGQDGKVVKSIDLNRTAWSVGGSKYSSCSKTGGGVLYGICTNANSVSIELCDNVDKDPSKEQIKAVKQTIKFIRKYCPRAKTVIRHFDVTGKACPARMVKSDKWAKFKNDIGEK